MSEERVAILGAGPGGYAAAFLAADLGMAVTLIDPEREPGGVCLYRGCIPSKALLHVARILDESARAAEFGLDFAPPRVDLERMRGWKEQVVGRLTGGLGQLRKQRRVDYIQGTAQFRDAHHLDVATISGEKRELAFSHAVIATGSAPARPAGFPPGSALIMDSTSALELHDIPGRLLVVGGGYIGLELGSVYAALGSRVTLVEMLDSLLPGVDADLVQPLQRRLESSFEAILLETRIEELAERKAGGVEVRLAGPAGRSTQVHDKVLVAVGRRPCSADLGLASTRVQVDDDGFIRTDRQRRTAEPSIFAIGDVAGQPMLAHKATHEGRTAVEVIGGKKAAFEPAAIPAVVFTDPEVAWCGLTEREARAQGREIRVARFPWAASGRALTLGRNDGLTKLILDPGSQRILGVGIAGPGAGELIAEGTLAVEMAALATDLRLTIHPHPTLSETLMECAEVFFGQSTHLKAVRRDPES